MENLCNNCIECCHKDVCAKYKATGGVRRCSNFMEMPKKGRWVDGSCSYCGGAVPTDNRYDYMDESDSVFCPYCGADMRGAEDG